MCAECKGLKYKSIIREIILSQLRNSPKNSWSIFFQETFLAFRSHNISFPEDEEQAAYDLQRDWESLYLGALYRASTLESTSDRFSGMTQEQIYDFVRELEEFARDFEAHGPGSVGDDLELGLVKMEVRGGIFFLYFFLFFCYILDLQEDRILIKIIPRFLLFHSFNSSKSYHAICFQEYGKLIARHDEKHRSLVKSEILFDLPATDYSIFLKLKKDYEGMEMLFELYKEQKEMRDVWAQTLWVNLNPQQLIEGMDHFIRIFRRLPKFVKELSIGHALEANMKSFKNSVPLFIELKNEAMRERHWKQLMTKTGQFFDMDPERCDDTDRN